MSRRWWAATLALVAVAPLAAAASGSSASVCADYANQAAAQHAADTRDADGDGVYCETLPCPCAGPGGAAGGAVPKAQTAPPRSCVRPRKVQNITFSKTRFPHIRAHFLSAL